METQSHIDEAILSRENTAKSIKIYDLKLYNKAVVKKIALY